MKLRNQDNSKFSARLAFGFLGLIGLATLIMGFASLNQNINRPKALRQQALSDLTGVATQNDLGQVLDSSATQQLHLQNKDTDQDGISDYEELYVYSTSPYLPDSDSDGFNDGQEISAGHDPNCPRGENCRTPGEVTGQVQSESEFFDSLLPAEELETATDNTLEAINNLTSDELRQLIVESGEISQEQLDQVSDEALMSAYQAALGTGLDAESAPEGSQ